MAPPPWPGDLLPEIARRAADWPVVVLDDDPTGTQAVRDLPVVTEWDAERIERHLDEPALFLSTNSRALEADAAAAVTRDAASRARQAASVTWRPVSFVSRSDSTLRGHFPLEVEALADGAGLADARILLAPYFGEGGRVTVGDVHLLERDGVRTPVAQTEFAQDATFGFRSSNLREWVAEKYATAGRATPRIASLSLSLVREGGPDAVAEALRRLPPGGVAIANAQIDRDIEIIALGALLAEEHDLPLVARTAASYVRARAGQSPARLLEPAELGVSGPGLIVVGSHVPTTTAQVEALRAEAGDAIARYELAVDAVLAGDPSVIADAAAVLGGALADGRTGLVMTERTRRDIGLAGGRSVSEALAAVVQAITERPAWVIAKGGITSYDVARHGLGLTEARIAGPLLPGVPVWVGGADSRWPGVPLVVFPGNVGGSGALVDAYRALTGR
jgi:uncharacterized protein YgbK (DUF1537 family)